MFNNIGSSTLMTSSIARLDLVATNSFNQIKLVDEEVNTSVDWDALESQTRPSSISSVSSTCSSDSAYSVCSPCSPGSSPSSPALEPVASSLPAHIPISFELDPIEDASLCEPIVEQVDDHQQIDDEAFDSVLDSEFWYVLDNSDQQEVVQLEEVKVSVISVPDVVPSYINTLIVVNGTQNKDATVDDVHIIEFGKSINVTLQVPVVSKETCILIEVSCHPVDHQAWSSSNLEKMPYFDYLIDCSESEEHELPKGLHKHNQDVTSGIVTDKSSHRFMAWIDENCLKLDATLTMRRQDACWNRRDNHGSPMVFRIDMIDCFSHNVPVRHCIGEVKFSGWCAEPAKKSGIKRCASDASLELEASDPTKRVCL